MNIRLSCRPTYSGCIVAPELGWKKKRHLGRLWFVMVFVLVAGGCIRRDGVNSDCRWPGESSNHPASVRHLSADAEFAEDLAIRYADAHFGRRTPNPSEDYPEERDRCMGRLFAEIGKQHGVPVERVADSLGGHRGYIDVAEVLPFALLYSLVAIASSRMVWRRYAPAKEGWASGIIMAPCSFR